MSHAKNKVEWCLSKAKKELQGGWKHRGVILVPLDIRKAREHIAKAEHNLNVTLYLHDGGYTDWCSSSLFYVIYHCFLAILAVFGYESRNQECTFALIQSLIEDKKINIQAEDLNKICLLHPSDSQEAATVIDLREEYQYGTSVSLRDNEYEQLLGLSQRIMEKAKEIVEMVP